MTCAGRGSAHAEWRGVGVFSLISVIGRAVRGGGKYRDAMALEISRAETATVAPRCINRGPLANYAFKNPCRKIFRGPVLWRSAGVPGCVAQS